MFFFFNDTATTEIYTLSLHDALPISGISLRPSTSWWQDLTTPLPGPDRKSTRLNSSHGYISYAVFCLKKKNIHHGAEHASNIVHRPLLFARQRQHEPQLSCSHHTLTR